ncbi:general transcription factor IIH subunit 1 [Aplysia californica]|uniref:General transcription factor IIH subunit 1 n=1 Tax=Aplysia californica TaxID=6500 RepID=A0ABM0JLH2_APLCA|nr:general transcription factor IIH subunit 1 [Aplysia californica]
MSKSSEEVLLIVKNVKNKKTDGTLYLMGERMAWMLESKNVFNISYMYADIKAQKISPDSKEKVQLQVILHDGSANTFLFNNPRSRQTQMQDRESVKELLQQLLPKFKRKISAELEEKNRLLQEDPESFQLYKDLVVSGVITPEEFWASRAHMLPSSTSSSSSSGGKTAPAQNVGVSPAFLADIKPVTDGANGLKYNLTQDIIQSIFKTYPMVKKKHAEAVPHQVSDCEFWSRFFQSHYFHRDRHALSSEDIFTECAKNDEEVMKDEITKNVNDPLVDLTQMKDQSLEDDYRGIVDDTRTSNNVSNQAMIRRFNQHSTLVLRACTSASTGGVASENSAVEGGRKEKDSSRKSKSNEVNHVNGGVAHPTNGTSDSVEEPHRKKKRIKEKIGFEDLDDKEESEGVTLRLTQMDRYLHGPTPSSSTASASVASRLGHDDVTSEDAILSVASEVEGWGSARHMVLGSTEALSVLGELSPGGALMSGTSLQQLHQQVSPATRDEIKQNYNAMCELLRHFWSCFPVSSKSLEDKVVKMRQTLERFEMSKLAPLKEKLSQYHYAMNLTGHLEEMLRAAYLKFDAWQARRNARRP